MSKDPNPPPTEPDVRLHTYDGIREFDNRLPNWWLFTLYAAILFWIGYWGYYEWFRVAPEGAQRVELALTRIEAAKLAATAALAIDDKSLWAMSRNPVFVEAGRQTFDTNCVACHLSSMRGKSENPTAIGPDLTDQIWIHGGLPTDVHRTVTQGVPEKGMPTWGPLLGPKRITEAVAYVLSRHHEGEPIIDAASVAPAK
jgi:cytochrome c oxidase cbb3-type subunit III